MTEVECDWEAKDVIAVYLNQEDAENKAAELKALLPEKVGWGGVYTYEVSEHTVQ